MSKPTSPAHISYGAATPFASIEEARRTYDVLARHEEVKELDTARTYVSLFFYMSRVPRHIILLDFLRATARSGSGNLD